MQTETGKAKCVRFLQKEFIETIIYYNCNYYDDDE